MIKRSYVPHIPYKRKRDQAKEEKTYQKRYSSSSSSSAKNKRWIVERTNSWHNRFRKLFIRYEKKVESYLGLVQSYICTIIIHRKIILG